jgi:hypothetical protein
LPWCGNGSPLGLHVPADATDLARDDDRVDRVDGLLRRDIEEQTAVTTTSNGARPATGARPTSNRFYLVATALGVTVSVISSIFVLLQIPSNAVAVVVGLIVGTLGAGHLVGANTARGWTTAFGAVLLLQIVIGLAGLTLVAALAPSVLAS